MQKLQYHMQRMRLVKRITDSMNMNVNKLQEIAEDRGTCVQQSMGLQRVGHKSVTEQHMQTYFYRQRT